MQTQKYFVFLLKIKTSLKLEVELTVSEGNLDNLRLLFFKHLESRAVFVMAAAQTPSHPLTGRTMDKATAII